MNNIFIYGIVFSLAGGAAAAGSYLLAPSRTVSAESESADSQGNKTTYNDNDEDEGEGFIPVALTPRDYLIDNLSKMKVLKGQGSVDLVYKDYNVNLDIKNIYLTLATLSDIEASVDATLTFNGVSTDISVTYANSTIYLTAFDTDLKFATADISKVTEMLSSFDLPEIELPSFLTSISLDSLQDKLGNMPYIKIDDGYRFDFELIDGCPIEFYSDDNYNFTALKAKDFQIEDINLNLDASVEVAYELTKPVEIPETVARPYADFANIIPLAKHIGELAKQKQFALSLSGDILDTQTNSQISVSGATQFDLDAKSGLAHLLVDELDGEKHYSHDVALDISSEDIIFNYNNTIKGKLAFSSLNEIVELIQSLIGNFDKDLTLSLDSVTSLLSGTVLGDVIGGKYELLLNNIVENIEIAADHVSLTIDKSLLNLDSDVDLSVKFNEDKLLSVSIKNLSAFNHIINLDVSLGEYSDSFSTNIDRTDLTDYGDCANLAPLVNGIKNLIEQKQFAISLDGSLKKNGQALGLTFNGTTQFDLDTKCGDGEITIVENESKYDTKPAHNIKIGVDNQEIRFVYNNNLKGKFTIQTIKDMFSVVSDLISSTDSRIYEWFGETIDNMNETLLMRIVNGEYGLLFHSLIKDMKLTDNAFALTVSGELFNLDNDISVKIGYNSEKITSLSIIDFNAFGYNINLNAIIGEYSDSYETLPTVDEDTYHDFSDIKTLAMLGLNVANLDYWHITGIANMNMDVIGISLNGLANLENMPIDVKIFENNGNICLKATLENIPTVGLVNGISTWDSHAKSLDLYYDSGYIYLTRHDYTRKTTLGIPHGDYYEVTDCVKVSADEFTSNILNYLLGWGMGLNRSSLIWNAINNAISENSERDSAMDYSEILNNYAYTSASTSSYGNYQWDLDLNIAEIANNEDLTSCTATIYGKELEFTNPTTNEKEIKNFLSHLDAYLALSTSGFNLDISAGLDLVDINPYLTYEDFSTNDLTKDNFAALKEYFANHANDSSSI